MARQTNININVNSTSAVKSINVLKTAFIDLNNTIKQTVGNDNKIKINVDLVGIDVATLKNISKALNKMNKSLKDLQASANQFASAGQVFNVTTNHITRNTTRVTQSTASMSKSFFASAVALDLYRRSTSQLIKDYAELSDATFGVGIAGQLNLTEISKLNDAFLSLSTTVPHSAVALAESVNDLIRTGRTLEESNKIMKEVAILSTASGDSLKDTAQIVTKVMTALDINADRTTDTLNAMHSTAINTASDMRFLAESFKNVAGTASVLVKSSGLAGEELDTYKQEVLDLTLSMTGALANLGLGASSAGTKLKVLYSRLTAMEKTAKSLFDEAMRINNVRVGGEILDSKKLSELAKVDLKGTVELLSKLYTEGKLSSQVMQKMFTGRHFMEISELFTQINGQVDTFTEGISGGVNYSQDFYKNMMNINTQFKLLNNNIANITQKHIGLGESLTGLTMLANDILPKLDKEGNNTVKTVSSMSLSFVGAGFGVATIMKYIVPLVKTLPLLNPWTIGIGALASFFALVGKGVNDVNKAFADTSVNLDNIKLSASNTENALKNIGNYLTTISNTANQANEFSIDGSQASDMFNLLTKDLDNFKDALSSLREVDFTIMDNLDSEVAISRANMMELEQSLEDLKAKKEEILESAIEEVTSKHFDMARDSIRDILKEYLKLKDTLTDTAEIEKKIFEYGAKKGANKSRVKIFIGELSKNKDLVNFIDEINKKQEETETAYEEVRKKFKDVQTTITANQEAFSKLGSEMANSRVKLFELTGEFNNLKGFKGLEELFKTSILENYTMKITSTETQITNLENKVTELKKLNTVESEKERKALEDKIDNLKEENKLREEAKKKEETALGKLKISGLENIEYSKEMLTPYFTLLSITKEIAMYSEDDPRVEFLKKYQEIVKDIIIQEDKRIKLNANKTSYQIKYKNYLKETLDLELEGLKIGKIKQEQDFLSYTYKIKQLELEKKVADAEKETAKESFKNVNVGKEWIEKAYAITDTQTGQKVIDDFYKQFKNVLEGKGGKELKAYYEAVTTYVNALSKSEGLENKIKIEPLKAINEFLLEMPNTVQESLTALDTLAKEGVIPFDNFGQKILDRMESDLEQSRDKVFKTFGIVGKDISQAIQDNLSSIDVYKKLLESKPDPSQIIDYLEQFKVKFKDNKDILNEIELTQKSGTVEEQKALITKLQIAEQKALLDLKNKELDKDKQDVLVLKEKLKYLSSASKLISLTGDIFGSKALSEIGKAFESIGNFQVNMKDMGKIDWKKVFNFNTEELNKAFETAFEGMQMGSAVGSAVGSITGGGQSAQQGGALGGLLSTGLGITGWGAVGMAVGGSLLGGMFDSSEKDKAESERKTKEANKIYNKNTEALQKLAQNMSNLSGGVDSLNNTLISAVSKIPTIDNINNVTDAMTAMYKTMDKTRKFNNVAYQVTRTKKSKGFLGIGGGSTSWTETIEISVNELLRRYGFYGALEDMTSQQIRDFSKWLDNYSLGDSDNFGILADALEDYAEGLDKFDKNISKFFRDTTMEAFVGISSLEQESLRQQIEDFYKNLGFQIDAEMSKQIDKLAEEMSVMVTIMTDVREEFLSQWRTTGQQAGSVFLKSMTPYIDAMLSNISQVYYDVYFSGINENLEKEFKNLSEQLVTLKKQGEKLDWSQVTGSLATSFDKVLTSVINTKNETASFNEILLALQKQALDAGLSLSEIFDLGLMSGTQKEVMDTFKEALMSGEDDGALTSIGEMLGDKIGETMANRMIDNLLSDRILEFSAQIDSIMSGGTNLTFDSLAGLANQAMSVGLMMESERQRLEAIKELFSYDTNIEYTTQNEEIVYEKGTSQQLTQIFNLSSNVDAGSVIEADNIERLAEGLLDVMLEKLKVDKGIDLTK